MTPSGLGRSAVGDPFGGDIGAERGHAARSLLPESLAVEGLDRLARLAAALTASPSAQVSLVSDVEHAVAGHGLEPGVVGGQVPLEQSICGMVVEVGTLQVGDAARDDRVRHLPAVIGGRVGAYLGVPLRGEDGQTFGALSVFDAQPRDWTATDVQLLQELAESIVAELQLASLTAEYDANRLVWQLAVDAAGVGAFDWNLTTGELRWDDRLIEMFGYDRRTFSFDIEAFNRRVHPDDLPRVTAALDHAIQTSGDYFAEYRIVLPGQVVRWVAARGRGLRGDTGQTERLIGAAYDTTDVHEGEARVGRVLEAMSTAFYQLDHDWRFTYVNAQAEQVIGQPREALLGGNIWELLPATADSVFEEQFRRAVETGEVVSFEAYYPEPLNGWFELRAYPTPDGLSVYFLEVTARRLAQDQLVRNAQRSELLATISGELTGTLDAEEAVGKLTRALVPTLGDWCTVTVLEASSDWRGALRDLGAWHADPDKLEVLRRFNEVRVDAAYDSDLVHQVFSDDTETIVVQDSSAYIDQVLRPGEARDLLARLDPGPAVSIPLRGRGRLLGLLSINRTAGSPEFDEQDVTLLEEIAARAGLALDNARLFAEQRDLAEGLQRSLLTEPGGSERLDIAVRYEPAAQAAQVGGDWYDSFLVHEGATMVVIGDVVGHDTAAAAAMGQVRGLLRAISVHTGDGPAQVLEGVDRAMDTLRVGVTATAVAAFLERLSDEERAGTSAVKRLRWSNAGHPDPVLVTSEGEVVALTGAGADLLLGLDPNYPRAEYAIRLEPGATVLLYTDGLVERRGQSLDEGLVRLRDVLRRLVVLEIGLEELCDRLLEEMRPSLREDDVALVVVRVK